MMDWEDTQVWLPTLLIPDFVMFPNCEIRLRVLGTGSYSNLPRLFKAPAVVNVFLAQKTDPQRMDQLQMYTVGTMSKIVAHQSVIDEEEPLEPLEGWELTLRGLFKVRCEGLREAADVLQSRFEILPETHQHPWSDWEQLLNQLRSWLQVLALQTDPELVTLLNFMPVRPVERFINRLCMQLPFDAAVKQELLELPDPFRRGQALAQLLARVVEQTSTPGETQDYPIQ